MNFDKISDQKNAKKIIVSILSLVAILVIFQAGVFVGYKKASFSFRYGESFYKEFGGKHKMPGIRGMLSDRDLPGGHGAVGKIISVDLPTLVISSPDNIEKIVRINNDTLIREFREKVSSTTIKVDDFVVVLGNPNDKGEVEAKLIRLIPPPEVESATSSTTNRNREIIQ